MLETLRRHRKAFLSAAVTVVVLAGVILIGSALAPGGKRQNETEQRPAATQTADVLVREAERALASGEATRAAAIASQVLQRDPSNTGARAVLGKAADLDAAPSQKPASEASDAPPPAPADDKAFLGDVDISAMLPKRFDRYSMGYVAAVDGNADVSAVPEISGMPAFRIAWAVRDRASVTAAESYLKNTTRALYPKSPDGGLQVDGAKAYFGTDGSELASIAYRRGRYVFEVVVVAEIKGHPDKLKTLATKAAEAFADKP